MVMLRRRPTAASAASAVSVGDRDERPSRRTQGSERVVGPRLLSPKWEFPKIGDTFFGGPYNKDPTI